MDVFLADSEIVVGWRRLQSYLGKWIDKIARVVGKGEKIHGQHHNGYNYHRGTSCYQGRVQKLSIGVKDGKIAVLSPTGVNSARQVCLSANMFFPDCLIRKTISAHTAVKR